MADEKLARLRVDPVRSTTGSTPPQYSQKALYEAEKNTYCHITM